MPRRSSAPVDFVTPRGTQRGHEAIREFMHHQSDECDASELVRLLHRGDTVVSESRIESRYVDRAS